MVISWQNVASFFLVCIVVSVIIFVYSVLVKYDINRQSLEVCFPIEEVEVSCSSRCTTLGKNWMFKYFNTTNKNCVCSNIYSRQDIRMNLLEGV